MEYTTKRHIQVLFVGGAGSTRQPSVGTDYVTFAHGAKLVVDMLILDFKDIRHGFYFASLSI